MNNKTGEAVLLRLFFIHRRNAKMGETHAKNTGLCGFSMKNIPYVGIIYKKTNISVKIFL